MASPAVPGDVAAEENEERALLVRLRAALKRYPAASALPLESDASLRQVARRLLQSVPGASEQAAQGNEALPTVAQRLGFAGVVLGGAVLPTDPEASSDALSALVRAAAVRPLNRYGLAIADGHWAVVLGSVELSLESFPARVSTHASVRLRGQVLGSLTRAAVFMTLPSGLVQQWEPKGRAVDVAVTLREPGRHQVEVMGYGPEGPRVLLNVPVWAGDGAVDAPERATPVPEALAEVPVSGERGGDPQAALIAELLTQLNAERLRAGLAPVAPDSELGSIARQHSNEMVQAKYLSHTSPTTGTPGDRVERAGLALERVGECIVRERGATEAHASLLASPAHRSVLLGPNFTHVGIGVTPSPLGCDSAAGAGGCKASPWWVMTLLFAQRSTLAALQSQARGVVELLQGERASRGHPPARIDSRLMAAAAAGAAAMGQQGGLASPRVQAAIDSALAQQFKEKGRPQNVCQVALEVMDSAQLRDVQVLRRAELDGLGASAVVLGPARVDGRAWGPHLGVVLLGLPREGLVLPCH